MQKTYWWRAILTVGLVVVLGSLYIGICDFKFSRCFGGNNILFTRTLFHFSLSILSISPFLFFIADSVFKKWLRFTAVWFILALIFIILAPEYQGGWIGIGPEKESVSIWMSSLFVIISLVKISWDSWKIKRG